MDVDTLLVCRDAMTHRGPDAAGYWFSDDRSVAFAHRRLAILDLSPTGEQPMVSASGKLAIVFNGEIYNHAEIRAQLSARGKVFRGRSDTEVLLYAYEEWGRDCLPRLRGMFAFGIYDQSKRVLLLARDRAGEKPLYWARQRGGFVFASELKAIMADPTFSRRLDLDGLDAYLAFGFVPHDKCILAGASKVPPGHWLQVSLEADTVTTGRYWKLPNPHVSPGTTDVALVDELHELLKKSVTEQLEADVPVAVLLSGGIDSSLVTAVAASAAAKPVRTFSVGFPDSGNYDERKHARLIADHFGTEHTELLLEQSSIDLMEKLAAQYDEPIADSSMIPTYLLSQLVSNHCKVVLGGDAGDELFGGYKAYQGAITLANWRDSVPLPLRYLISRAAETMLPPGFPNRNGLVGLGGGMAKTVARMGLMYDWARRIKIAPCLRALRDVDTALAWKSSIVEPNRGVPGAFMAADFSTYLPEDILVKVDRASMANSLEVRVPFLDERIIDFAFTKVPNCLRTTRDARKILLRQLARRILPQQFDIDRKQGFSIPLSAWLPRSYRIRLCETLEHRLSNLFDFREIRRLMESEHTGGIARAFGLILLMQWTATYNVRTD